MGAPFPKVALVSHVLPPSPSGQAMALHRMLRGWPADRLCLLSREPGGGGAPGPDVGALSGRRYLLAPAAPPAGSRLLPTETLRTAAGAARGILRRARRIAEILAAERCDLVVACTGDLHDLPAACLASRRARIPFVPYLFDDYVFQWTGAARTVARRLEPHLMRRSRAILVPNEFLGQEYLRRHGVSGAVFHNPCLLPDLPALDESPRVFDPGETAVVYAGAVYHAHHDAFRNLAAAISRPGLAGVKLHIFTAQSRDEIARAGLAGPAVVHHPHIAPGEVPRVLRGASVLFLPLAFDSPIPEAIRTSAPGKTGEYLSVARPVLVHAPADSFLSWYFRANRCGLVVDRNDPGVLAAALARLASDPDLRGDLGRSAREAAERDFDVNKIRPKFEEFLKGQVSG